AISIAAKTSTEREAKARIMKLTSRQGIRPGTATVYSSAPGSALARLRFLPGDALAGLVGPGALTAALALVTPLVLRGVWLLAASSLASLALARGSFSARRRSRTLLRRPTARAFTLSASPWVTVPSAVARAISARRSLLASSKILWMAFL